jgi:hypothetical protein
VVLPLRDAFTLHLVRLPNQLPDTPIQSPVLLDEKFSLTTRGGLHVARGTVGRDLTPSLDDKWIAPTAVVGGSRKVCAAAAKLCERLEQLDGQFLASANTPETRTLLARWTGFFAAWRAMGDATPLDEYLVRTDRFLTQMWSDTRAIFGTEDHAAAGDADSLAGAFRRLMANVEGLAATWGSLLQTPMTMEIPLLCEPKQRRVGNHTEIILRAKQRPLPCESVIFKASTESPFGLDVAAVRVDLNESHTNRPPRTSLTAPAPGTVTCRIALTPEERAEGRIRLFVHRELNLSSITIEGD